MITVIVALVVFAGVVTAAKYVPIPRETTGAATATPPADHKSPEQTDRVRSKSQP